MRCKHAENPGQNACYGSEIVTGTEKMLRAQCGCGRKCPLSHLPHAEKKAVKMITKLNKDPGSKARKLASFAKRAGKKFMP